MSFWVQKKKMIYAFKILNIIHELIKYVDTCPFVLRKKRANLKVCITHSYD